MEKGKTVHGKQGKSEVVIDKSIDDVSPENFDALFIPGKGYFFDIADTFMFLARAVFDQILDEILSWPEGSRLQRLAPMVRGRKGEFSKVVSIKVKK